MYKQICLLYIHKILHLLIVKEMLWDTVLAISGCKSEDLHIPLLLGCLGCDFEEVIDLDERHSITRDDLHRVLAAAMLL